jgi:hypothetical protein
MAQCSGGVYDNFKRIISDTEDQAAMAEEEGNGQEVVLSKYKDYLARCKKAYKIAERSRDITATMATKLQGRGTEGMPAFFHISAASYMNWIKKEKIIFSNQPALSPSATGIPELRQFLYHLPTKNNLADVTAHVHIVVPTFIEKLKRAAIQSDRDAGFRTLADEFDQQVRGLRLNDLLSQAKFSFKFISLGCITKIRADMTAYKTQIKKTIKQEWFFFKGQTWNRVLKARGMIPKGASKAQGLKDGCNWNEDLAKVMAPGFRRCVEAHIGAMKNMASSLIEAVTLIHQAFVSIMDNSAANLLIVDRAKNK